MQENTNLPPEPEILSREIYITPEQLAIMALVDAMDERIFKPWEPSHEGEIT